MGCGLKREKEGGVGRRAAQVLKMEGRQLVQRVPRGPRTEASLPRPGQAGRARGLSHGCPAWLLTRTCSSRACREQAWGPLPRGARQHL